MIIQAIRKLLINHNAAYNLFADIYHFFINCYFFLKSLTKNHKFFFPRKAYGFYKSQYGQDVVLEKLGLLKKNGFFVEVGSNHPVFNSNTYFLEKVYEYKGVSIDPIDYSVDFKKFRPRTTFLNNLVSNNNNPIDFYQVKNNLGWENQMSSINPKALKKGRGFNAIKRRIKPISLKDLDINSVDILFIDVEGSEIGVLKSIDWKKVKPHVIVIENSGQFYMKSFLTNFLKKRNYRLVAQIGYSDEIYTSLY